MENIWNGIWIPNQFPPVELEVHSTWNIPNSIPFHSIPIPDFACGIGMEYSML
jgi:hypothetical protein